MTTTTTDKPRETKDETGKGAHDVVTYTPRVDIAESSDELLLYADLPGVASDDLDVRYENRELVIDGKVSPRQDGAKYLCREYGVGHFHREFSIGETIDPEKICAELKNGVLTVRLPKSAAVKPRQIEVQAG